MAHIQYCVAEGEIREAKCRVRTGSEDGLSSRTRTQVIGSEFLVA